MQPLSSDLDRASALRRLPVYRCAALGRLPVCRCPAITIKSVCQGMVVGGWKCILHGVHALRDRRRLRRPESFLVPVLVLPFDRAFIVGGKLDASTFIDFDRFRIRDNPRDQDRIRRNYLWISCHMVSPCEVELFGTGPEIR